MIPDVSRFKINKTAGDPGEFVDVMNDDLRWQVDVHDKGFVALVDVMPRRIPAGGTADFAIVQAARVSYGKGTKSVSDDEGLIRYLMRHRHTTPFEMVEMKFHAKMPIFVARQWIRHRTANVNEYSARYSILEDDFYRPKSIRAQSDSNKQGSSGEVDVGTAEAFLAYLDQVEASFNSYERLVNRGVAKELARIGLPQNIYTQWYWKIDLHNLLQFLALRQDPHAQQEIRDYADAMYALVKQIVPVTCIAFEDYHPLRGGMLLSRMEVEALATGRVPPSIKPGGREFKELQEKFKRINLKVEDLDSFTDVFAKLFGNEPSQ